MSGATVLAALWVALGLAAVEVVRPRRRMAVSGAVAPAAAGPLARLGGAARRAVTPRRRRCDLIGAPDAPPTDDVSADTLIGGALVGAVVLLLTAPTLAPVLVVVALAAPRVARRRAERSQREQWADALPDAVDLLALGLASGVAVGPVLALVAPHTPAPVGPTLAEADERARHGVPLADALEPLARASPDGRSLVALLVAAHHDGAPVVEALSRLAADLRADRRRAVEARARQVPVRMLFPLVACTLPAFVLLTIVPPVVAALSDLQR